MKKARTYKRAAAVAAVIIALSVYAASRSDNGAKSYVRPSVVSFEAGTSREAEAKRYEDPAGFSFELPEGYSARKLSDEGGDSIILERGSTGFQLYVSTYDEPASGFTALRVRRDIPDLVMKNVEEFAIRGGRGIEFDSESGHEIWFVIDGSLYQISSPQSEAANAKKVRLTFDSEI